MDPKAQATQNMAAELIAEFDSLTTDNDRGRWCLNKAIDLDEMAHNLNDPACVKPALDYCLIAWDFGTRSNAALAHAALNQYAATVRNYVDRTATTAEVVAWILKNRGRLDSDNAIK